MEKIRVKEKEFDLVPASLIESDKRRTFTVQTDIDPTELEAAFEDVSNVQYILESGEVYKTYLDGVALKSVTHNIEEGTYTLEISTDVVEAELKYLREQIEALTK